MFSVEDINLSESLAEAIYINATVSAFMPSLTLPIYNIVIPTDNLLPNELTRDSLLRIRLLLLLVDVINGNKEITLRQGIKATSS